MPWKDLTIVREKDWGSKHPIKYFLENHSILHLLLESRSLSKNSFDKERDSKKIINTIEEKFGNNPNFILEEGIIPPEKFHNSKCMISDWSGISFEYAFTFERPVIFIDLPKKILNSDSGDISLEPIEISIRDKIGYVISPKNLEKIPEIIKNTDSDSTTNERIIKIRSETVYNLGKSAKIGVEAIEKIHMELNKWI